MKFAILVLCLTLFVIDNSVNALECYQCKSSVLNPCKVEDAENIKCSGTGAVCFLSVPIGQTDKTNAIRKCAMPDNTNKVACPDGQSCDMCNHNLCNAAFTLSKMSQFTLIGIVMALMYYTH